MNTYPRETDQFVEVDITLNGSPTTTGITFAVVPDGTRPTTFTAAKTRGQVIGVEITGLTPGMYHVYAKATDTPYAPVIDCGVFQVT